MTTRLRSHEVGYKITGPAAVALIKELTAATGTGANAVVTDALKEYARSHPELHVAVRPAVTTLFTRKTLRN